MTKPVRLQLSRARGFNLQEISRATNGLYAVNVARPGKWGNPYHLADDYRPYSHLPWGSVERAQGCVDHYRKMAIEGFVTESYTKLPRPDIGPEAYSFGAHSVAEVAPQYLRGKNLACWCALDAPCHADVLLELANAGAA